jgi:3-oxoadipate enol-lactonase
MTLAHDVTGSGPAVVLVHSGAGDRRMWDPQLPALVDAGYRVVRGDLRGFGETPMPQQPFNNAQDIVDLMDALGLEKAALIGSSFGGRVALEVAARWPDRLTCLVLLCAALAGHQPSAQLRTFGEREDALLEAGDIAGATELNVATWLGPEADDAARDSVRRMQRHAFEVQLAGPDEIEPIDHKTDLSAITAPCLIVSGARDVVDFQQIAVHLAGQLRRSWHIELDWAGHLPNLERPDLVNPMLIEFLRYPSSFHSGQ